MRTFIDWYMDEYGSDYEGQTKEQIIAWLERLAKGIITDVHCGDCIKVPCSCPTCYFEGLLVEYYNAEVLPIREKLLNNGSKI